VPPSDAELAFVDQVGRFFNRQYALAPATGRVVGWLLICDPPGQTAAQIAEELQLSRSAVGQAVAILEAWQLVRRTRVPGERADRIVCDPAAGVASLESSAEYTAQAALARDGLELLKDASVERRGRLLELAAFADFLIERMPGIAREWREHRDALRATGELP
jgi:DNA-binding MarR family transcriptional regulator